MHCLRPDSNSTILWDTITMIFLRLRSIINTARKRGWNVIETLGGSPKRFIEALDYPEEFLNAFKKYL